MPKGLGRREKADLRDLRYRMGDHLKVKYAGVPMPDYKVWENGRILDQGVQGACVGFAWAAWENCKPLGFKRQQGDDYGFGFYREAQELDEWPGSDYSGTSVRAGAKTAVARGLAKSFVWASSLAEIDAHLLLEGPVVMGTSWLRSMDDWDGQGYLSVRPDSGERGGHAWLLYGKEPGGSYIAQNSWGPDYAVGGSFRLTPTALETLVAMGAEACACTQTGVPPR